MSKEVEVLEARTMKPEPEPTPNHDSHFELKATCSDVPMESTTQTIKATEYHSTTLPEPFLLPEAAPVQGQTRKFPERSDVPIESSESVKPRMTTPTEPIVEFRNVSGDEDEDEFADIIE